MGINKNYKKLFKVFLTIIIFSVIVTTVLANTVPKSETIVIPGELNDSLENAQYFNPQIEYTYGDNSQQTVAASQSTASVYSTRAIVAMTIPTHTVSYRRTYMQREGVMIATLNNDLGATYSLEVFNSCNENLCNPTILSSTQQHCVINIVPDHYYFKVTLLSGTGKHVLDVDYLNGHNDSALSAKLCSKPIIIDYSPNREISLIKGEIQDFNILVFVKDKENLQIKWFVDGTEKGTGINYKYAANPLGVHKIVAIAKTKAYQTIIDWNVTVNEPYVECKINPDCGTDTNTSAKYCKGTSVYQKFNSNTCNNPGKTNSFCSSAENEKLIENCKSCFNGACVFTPVLTCPTTPINASYSFTWNVGDYNKTSSLELAYKKDFSKKTSITLAKINPIPITTNYKTLIDYEKLSADKKLYARLYATNKKGTKIHSNICEFTLKQPSSPVLNCPASSIDENYSFSKINNDYNKKITLELSFDITFKNKETIDATKTLLTAIKTKFSNIIALEKKSTDKKLYARLSATDTYDRTTTSNVCSFTLRRPILPTLVCPTKGIDQDYLFNWNSGEYKKSSKLELTYDTTFKQKTTIAPTATNPIAVKKSFSTLQTYSKKTTLGTLYARINSTDKYDLQAYSNTCTFKLKGKSACAKTSDCGVDTNTTPKYCKNNFVYQKFNTPSCTNPGEETAKCTIVENEKLIQTCNACFNGTCVNGPVLECPTSPIDETYSFAWQGGKNTISSLQLGNSPSFTDFNYTEIYGTLYSSPTPILNKYKDIIFYANKTTDKKMYARISAVDETKKRVYSNICPFTLKTLKAPTLVCPTTITPDYNFSWNAGDYKKQNLLQFSYDTTFNTFISINTTTKNPFPIKNNYKPILDYLKGYGKSPTNPIYARIYTTDAFGRSASTPTCKITLGVTKLSSEEITNPKLHFEGLVDITNLPTNIYPSPPTTTITNTETINLPSITLIPITNPTTQTATTTTTPMIQAALPVQPQLKATVSLKIVTTTNSLGEIEKHGTYYVKVDNNLSKPVVSLSAVNSFATSGSCQYKYTGTIPCDSALNTYTINIDSIYNEMRYRFIDCTTGNIIGQGEMCSGENTSTHYRPDGHSVKFEVDYYSCPGNACKTEPLNLCSGVSCPNLCKSSLTLLVDGTCNQGVCNYSPRTCPDYTCSNSTCPGAVCLSGWMCKNTQTKVYKNTDCSFSNETYCINGCTLGMCNTPSPTCTTGWKCFDSETRGYQNSDCTWGTKNNCPSGCNSSTNNCNSTCTSGWACKDTQTKALKNSDCSWSNETNCPNGCTNGTCNATTCTTGWKCVDSQNKAYQKSDCSWNSNTNCASGCSNGSCLIGKIPGDEDYCTTDKQCQAGEGNCRNGNECLTGLYCMEADGANYGYSPSTNVCEAREGTGEWKCYSGTQTGFRLYSTGEWANVTTCAQGCVDGACKDSILTGTDTDKDGYSNDDELLAGSDPNNFDSTPFTELAKYSETIKQIPKMNAIDLITNVLQPYLVQKASFEACKNSEEKIQTSNAIHFSSINKCGASFSENQPLAIYIGFSVGFASGFIGAISDLQNITQVPGLIIEAIMVIIQHATDMKLAANDIIAYFTFIADPKPATGQAVTTLKLIWDGVYREKLIEGKQISLNQKYIKDLYDSQGFSHAYASGYMSMYISASTVGAEGAAKTGLKALENLKLGLKAAQIMKGVAEYPKLAELISKGGVAGDATMQLLMKYPFEWVNTVAGKTGTKMDEVVEIFNTVNKDGVNLIGYRDKTQTLHALAEHVIGPSDEVAGKKLNSFFPMGQTVYVNGIEKTLPPNMTQEQMWVLTKNVLESGTKPYSSGPNLVFESVVNKYGIKTMRVVVDNKGKYLTSIPLDGEAVYAWIEKEQKILQVLDWRVFDEIYS